MPRNDQIKRILLIGSGPIVIGQGCEFDYSGVQACKALREEGYQVVLVNSNPATIMTDPEFADRTYIEPITAEVIEAIIKREKPDALLPTMGGQTALNAAMELYRNGALARHGVKLIGANAQAIAKGEDRQLFKEAMLRIGLDVPRSGIARSLADANRVVAEIGEKDVAVCVDCDADGSIQTAGEGADGAAEVSRLRKDGVGEGAGQAKAGEGGETAGGNPGLWPSHVDPVMRQTHIRLIAFLPQ